MSELKKDSVERTLCIPLWSRAIAVKKLPQILPDHDAVRILKEMGEAKPPTVLYYLECGALAGAIRQYDFAFEIREYLNDHPRACVVELGAGLSCLRRQLKNDSNPWINIDFPDVIADRKKVCGNVLIAGAGLTGLETAEKLFRTDSADKITVIDMLPQIGANMYPSIFIDVTHQMEGKPLTLLAGRKLKEVTASGIIAENIADQTSEEIAADYVILAMGTRADSETIAAYESAFDRVITLGQTHKNPGRIATSLAEGYIAARGFDPVA